MKKKIKKIFIIVASIALIIFAVYRLGILPIEIKEVSGKPFSEIISELTDVDRKEDTGLLNEILENLDSGKESNESKKEEENSSFTDFEKSLECFYVTKIVDGDTIWVTNDNHPNGIKVRYIGIDTPESVADEESSGKKNTKEGQIASERNREIIENAGFDVYLEFDVEKEDQYNRTLAYVYIYDFENNKYEMIEEILLKEGLCKVMSIKPNTKYEDKFYALEETARKNKTGFFETGFYE